MRVVIVLLVLWMSSSVIAQDTDEPDAEATEAAQPVDVSASNLGVLDSYFLTDNDTPLLGQPFELTLVVEAPLDATITEWPEVVSDEQLEVLEASEVEETESDDGIAYQQTLEVLLWEVGQYLSPEYAVGYTVGGSEFLDPVRSVFIVVPSSVSPEDPPRPSRPPIDLQVVPLWIYGVIGFFAALVLLLVLLIALRARRGFSRLVFGNPLQRTINQLEDLRYQKLPPTALYPIIANYLRHFIRESYEIDAVEMTTDELLTVLRDQDSFTPELRRQLQQLLEQADLVKFARLQPDEQSTERLIKFAIQWLRAVSRIEKATANA